MHEPKFYPKNVKLLSFITINICVLYIRIIFIVLLVQYILVDVVCNNSTFSPNCIHG